MASSICFSLSRIQGKLPQISLAMQVHKSDLASANFELSKYKSDNKSLVADYAPMYKVSIDRYFV